jgi:hypothetical protein
MDETISTLSPWRKRANGHPRRLRPLQHSGRVDHVTETGPSQVAAPFGGLLDAKNHQGKFGEHLTQLIVTSAGFQCTKPDDTGDGIDLVVSRTHPRNEPFRPPNVELQVKASRALRSVGADWSYDLEVAHYDCLRSPGAVPRYLILVDVRGANARDWVGFGGDFIVFHRAIFWTSLAGFPPTENTTTVAVPVPKRNRYTPFIVKRHMKDAREEFEQLLMRTSS